MPMEHGGNNPEFDSLDTGQADVTNETFVRTKLGADSSSTSSGSWINGYDGELKDVRGEFNSSGQFSPDETGEYIVIMKADIRGNTSQNDNIGARVRNVTDSSTETPQQEKQSPGSIALVGFEFVVQLDSSKTYELQFKNGNSSYVIKGNSNTRGVIIRSVVA